MKLPIELIQAIEDELVNLPPSQLARAAVELSNNYRTTGNTTMSAVHRLAYIATRMPATYAASYSVLNQLKQRYGQLDLETMLDLGAGPGTAMWAAKDLFTSLKSFTLIERDPELIKLGQRLAAKSSNSELASANWLNRDLKDNFPADKFDLIVISYAICELDERLKRALLQRAWSATKNLLVIIEPGTQPGFANILNLRSELIALGAHIIAPCPHSSQCPMGSDDWCHFSQRIERTRRHKQAKSGALSYEDEKFSYIVASPLPVEYPQARIIRHPIKKIGYINLALCTQTGLQHETITKKNKEAYKRARKADWGNEWHD